ncbi:MAG: copper chaperone PCu(A)C [Pseudomonadota bacterium]
MNRFHTLASAFVLSFSSLLTPAMAADHEHAEQRASVQVENPWSRPTPPGTPMGVGYMTISNHGDQDIRLVAAESPRAGHVSIHETIMKDDVMRMQSVKGGLRIPAGESVKFKPMSYHLMLEQLKQPLAEGEKIPVTLDFEGADHISVELVVQPLGGKPEMDHSNMGH